jgi:hypothetical protein
MVRSAQEELVRWRPRLASKYLCPFHDPRVGEEVFAAARESTVPQAWNLNAQIANLYYEAGRHGKRVIGHVTFVGGSHSDEWMRLLSQAADEARRRGATLFGESTDRFRRHPGYHPATNQDAQARWCDLEGVTWYLDGCPAATLLHPDATPLAVRAYQTRRGIAWAMDRGDDTAAGYKTRLRRRWLRRVLYLHRAGASLGQIEEWTGILKMTASRWINNWER